MKNSASYFCNRECEYFPCHKVAEDTEFNCLFCYCPLYFVKDCGGNPCYTEAGVKDCSRCMVPHKAENYGHILQKLAEKVENKA